MNVNIWGDNYSTEEVAKTLCKLAQEPDEAISKDCDEAIFYLKCIADNEYNNDCFRTMWKVLMKITSLDWET